MSNHKLPEGWRLVVAEQPPTDDFGVSLEGLHTLRYVPGRCVAERFVDSGIVTQSATSMEMLVEIIEGWERQYASRALPVGDVEPRTVTAREVAA